MDNNIKIGRIVQMHTNLHNILQPSHPNTYRIARTAQADNIAMTQNMYSGECFWINSEMVDGPAQLRLVQ